MREQIHAERDQLSLPADRMMSAVTERDIPAVVAELPLLEPAIKRQLGR